MKYERFEQLPVWQAAMTLGEKTYCLTQHRAFARLRELKDQLRRAALSVSNNIAEGFERGTTAELLAFLYIARGSAGEVRSMLLFCQRLLERRVINPSPGTTSDISNMKSQISHMKSQISNLKSHISNLKSQIAELMVLAESCSRQIRGWADHLQNTEIQGQRRLNDKTRKAWEGQKSTTDFLAKLQQIRDDADAEPARTREDA